MSRKHYKSIAKTLRAFQYDMPAESYLALVWQMGEALQADNERFSMVRWEDACNVTNEFVASATK